jgi:hypothetical protein
MRTPGTRLRNGARGFATTSDTANCTSTILCPNKIVSESWVTLPYPSPWTRTRICSPICRITLPKPSTRPLINGLQYGCSKRPWCSCRGFSPPGKNHALLQVVLAVPEVGFEPTLFGENRSPGPARCECSVAWLLSGIINDRVLDQGSTSSSPACRL